MISITIDLEWATEPVLRDTIDLLESHNIEATLFSTHDDSLICSNHERALHPDFYQEDSADAVLDELCDLYPDSIGVRSHQMFISSKLRDEFVTRGIEYESNYMAYKVEDIVPFSMPAGTVQFPVYWMDDTWFRHDEGKPDINELLEPSGLKAFIFHPQHVTFNTPSAEYHSKYRDEYWGEEPDIDELRYHGYGVRDIFEGLLEHINDHGIKTHKLGELHTKFVDDSCSDWSEGNTVE